MAEPLFRCRRAIYLCNLPPVHIEAGLATYVPSMGRKKRVGLGLSDEHAGWRVLGIPEAVPDDALHEIAWSLFGGDDSEDFDLEKLAAEIDVPDDSIVVVQWVPGVPKECSYALYEANDNFEVLFSGRRDDGKGLRIDVVEGSAKAMKESKRFTLPVVEYLRSRGVPEALLPGADGIVFPPQRRLAITVNVE